MHPWRDAANLVSLSRAVLAGIVWLRPHDPLFLARRDGAAG